MKKKSSEEKNVLLLEKQCLYSVIAFIFLFVVLLLPAAKPMDKTYEIDSTKAILCKKIDFFDKYMISVPYICDGKQERKKFTTKEIKIGTPSNINIHYSIDGNNYEEVVLSLNTQIIVLNNGTKEITTIKDIIEKQEQINEILNYEIEFN